MIDPDVRPATHADVPQLADLERIARRLVAGQRGGDRWLATNTARDGEWRSSIDDSTVTVAHIGEVLVG